VDVDDEVVEEDVVSIIVTVGVELVRSV